MSQQQAASAATTTSTAPNDEVVVRISSTLLDNKDSGVATTSNLSENVSTLYEYIKLNQENQEPVNSSKTLVKHFSVKGTQVELKNVELNEIELEKTTITSRSVSSSESEKPNGLDQSIISNSNSCTSLDQQLITPRSARTAVTLNTTREEETITINEDLVTHTTNTTNHRKSMKSLYSSSAMSSGSVKKIESNENILRIIFCLIFSFSFMIYLTYAIVYYSAHRYTVVDSIDNSSHTYLLPIYFLAFSVCLTIMGFCCCFLWKRKKVRSIKKYKLRPCGRISLGLAVFGFLVFTVPFIVFILSAIVYLIIGIVTGRDANYIGLGVYGGLSVISILAIVLSSILCLVGMKTIFKKRKRKNVPLVLFTMFRHSICSLFTILAIVISIILVVYLAFCISVSVNYQYLTVGLEISIYAKLLYFLTWISMFVSIAFGIQFFKLLPKTTLITTVIPVIIAAVSFALSIVEIDQAKNEMSGSFRNMYGVIADNNYILDQGVTLGSTVFFSIANIFTYMKINLK